MPPVQARRVDEEPFGGRGNGENTDAGAFDVGRQPL
jgi:hypothetical protein